MAAVLSFNSCSCLPSFTAATPLPRKALRVLCVISTSKPRKFTIRKNYLRQKLLKTLPKPCPNLIPIETQSEEGLGLPENEQFGEAEIKESSSDASLDGILGKFPKFSALQFFTWFFGGACVLYAVVVALDYGYLEFENRKRLKKVGKYGVLEVGLNGKGQSSVNFLMNDDRMGLENDGVVYLDEGEMQKKIEEIRIMAREARAKEKEKEKSEGKRDGYESDEEAEVDSSTSGIEKEVIDRLVKLSKKLEKKIPVESVDNLKKEAVKNGGNNLGRKESNEALMFKKKYKFRGLESRPSDNKPMGFSGRIDDTSKKDAKSNGEIEAMMNGGIEMDSVVDLFDNVLHWEENKSGKHELEGPKSSRTAGNKSTDVSNEHGELKETSKLKSVEVEHRHSGSRIGRMESESETEPWWSSLRYVLAILMLGEHDGSSTGLFTLRNISARSGLSHAVAFEDRVDASNFCYLVQSFFEDLEGFTAEVVPIPTKELIERVKSQTMKVIVVKKGQLKLFAGQPLQDVEMALRALVDQS